MHAAPASLGAAFLLPKWVGLVVLRHIINSKNMAVKKVVKKVVVKKEKPIGMVTHYFGHIGVGIIKLAASLEVGDEVRITGGEKTDFNQTVNSMQIDHQEVKTAAKGKVIGLKVKEIVRQGYKVYRA